MPVNNSPSLQINPVIQDVWNKLKTERRPLSVQDFVGLDPKLVANALASLYRQGYVYNVEGLWAPTQATVTNKAKTYTPTEEITGVKLPSKNFFDNYLAPVLSHFLKIHPEYKATFDFLFKNPVYRKGITEDIQKILSREYVKFDPRKATIPRYKYPEILNSVEQALVEELGEINKYHSSLKGKVPSVATNKATADFFNQLMQTQGDQIIANVLNEAGLGRPGHILTEAEIKQTIANGSVKEVIKNKRIDKVVFQDYLYNAISNSSYAKEHNILVEGMGDEDILRIFGMQLQANLKRAADVINNFRSSGLVKKYPGILSGRDLKEANFTLADLSDLMIANSDFTDANFSNAKFDGARIKNNNFYKAKFIDASLVNVAAFEDNIIGQADFQGAAIPKGFPDESNTGIPINLNFHEIAHSEEGLDAALNLKSHSVHSLPLEEEEIDDAKAIMKALHGVLQHRNVLSSLKLSWEEPDPVELAKEMYDSGEWLSYVPSNGKAMKKPRKYQPGELVAKLVDSEHPASGKYYYVASYSTPGTGNYILLNAQGQVRKSQNIRKIELLSPEQKDIVFGQELPTPSLSSLSLTASSLTEAQVQQLRTWIQDPEALPDFLPPDSMNWLVLKNKSGELAAAGLVKAEINKLFGRARNLSAPKEPVISPEEQKKQLQNQSIEQFINKYKDAEEFPVEDVLSLMSETQGELRNLISAYGPMLSQAEARAILYGLASSLNQYHVPKSVTPKKWIKAFPYSVSMNNLSDTGTAHGVAGRGKQFGILIRPNLAQMSPELANSTMIAIEEAGTHLRGALAFSRIMPYHYTSIGYRGTESPTVKNVWFISEMQSDAYQKGNDEIKSKEKARAFRNYFRHWPEVLLGAIITQAQKAGVDEIWMPEGKEVIAKTDASKLKEDSWDYAYDRPAKAYGGRLKSIGDNILLDPGSSYKRTTNMAYVIDISGIKQKASLKVAWEEPEIANNTEELIQLLAPYQVWELSNTTPKFYLYLGEKPSLFETSDSPSNYTVRGVYTELLTNNPGELIVYLPLEKEYPLTLVAEDWRKLDKEANLRTFAKAIDDYKDNIIHHMKFIIDENLPKFQVISKYVTMDMLAQFAFRTFFDEYGVPEELKNDSEFIGDVKKVFEDEFGARIWEPPYIDWLHWLQKALNDVLYYVHNQRHNVQPDMTVSDQELARDWFNFWLQDQVPSDIKGAPWFVSKFIPAVRQLVKEQGLGDVLSRDFIPPQTMEERTQQIIHPSDTGEGEKILEGEGEGLLPEEEVKTQFPGQEKNVKFLSPTERRKTIDKYLDELSTAQESGDNAKVNEIKQKLQELSASSSLKLSWEELTKEEELKINILHAIYCAEAVLPIYENKYPNDNRPRLAIEAAKTVLKYPTEENKAKAKAAAWAADDAADDAGFASHAAAYAAARAATWAAAWAADAAANAIKYAKKAAKEANIDIDFDSLLSRAQSDIWEYINISKSSNTSEASKASLKVAWEEQTLPPPRDDVYPYSVKTPSSPRISGTYLWILKNLYDNGPQRIIQLWEKYVSERKGKDPDRLRENYYGQSPEILNRGVSVKYYQGVSSRINDLVHFGWIGKSAETKYYYVLLPKGLKELKKAGMV